LDDNLRPAGGVLESVTGTGASGLVAVLDEDDEDDERAPLARGVEWVAVAGCAGCGVAASEPAAACAVAGSAQIIVQAIGASKRRIRRA
jgi:hypothetical protein